MAYFAALPGCQTWGPTYAAAITRAEEALPLYLETLAMNGDDIPEDAIEEPVSLGVTVRTRIIA